MIIDTHTHFYDPTREGGTPWPEPEDEVLHQPTLPSRCAAQAVPCGVEGTIMVECSHWVEDNQWVLDLAKEEPFILGMVGNLNANDDRFEEHLDRFSHDPIFRGIRARLWKPADIGALRLLAERDLSLDIGLSEEAPMIAKEIPDLRIIINHSAGIPMDGEEPPREIVALMREVASYPNVFCKLSGMMDLRCTIRPAPTDVSHYVPALDLLWEAFGENRMIFGSDWPVSDHSGRSYAEVLTLAQEYVRPKGELAMAKVFRENSLRAYKWKERPRRG